MSNYLRIETIVGALAAMILIMIGWLFNLTVTSVQSNNADIEKLTAAIIRLEAAAEDCRQ